MTRTNHSQLSTAAPLHLPKLCGADIELCNFILGVTRSNGTAREAALALLHEIDAPYAARDLTGYGVAGRAHQGGYNPQDFGRRFLSSNGGCIYIDLDHLELCLPEVLNAWDHVAAWHAMLRIARRALDAANAKLGGGQRVHVLVNNSDGQGNAYGSHLDFLITRTAFDNLFDRKLHHLLFLAAYQASSIIFTGQGKVGAENGRPAARYQLSQRADFFETLTGVQTTYRRPIVNSRDEALCGPTKIRRGEPSPAAEMARLHCIMYDNTLCHGSSLLKVGVMQIILAMIEAEHIDTNLILDDPVDAIVRWSHDPTLRATAATASGTQTTALDMQLRFLDVAQRFVTAGGCDDVVPRAAEIVALWEDTLRKLQADDVTALAGRLDWVLKFRILQRALQQRPQLTWASPEIKHLDHLYSSLDPNEGLYWAYERLGAVERVVSDAHIERFVHEPPDDTRAWSRAMLLRVGEQFVDSVDWDQIKFRKTGRGYWPVLRTVQLANPLGFTRTATEDVILDADSLDDILDKLQASQPAIDATPTLDDWGGNGRSGGHGQRGWDEC